MRFLIKNITGDPDNVNLNLRMGRKLYACSENLSNTQIIGPGETVSVSAKAFEELTSSYGEYIQVIDTDGSVDLWAPFRKTVTLVANTWTLVDLGRVSGSVVLHNDSTFPAKWSFSGYTAPATAPDPQFISDLDPDEVLTFTNPMNPIRYFYLFSTNAAVVKILVN